MTSIRKIIGKLSKRDAIPQDKLRVHAFGKLPLSREYLHLNAGEGRAKAFVDWIKTGHDDWIRRTLPTPTVRARLIPTCFAMELPEWGNLAAVGCLWPSQDGGSSPRAFPFTLFTLIRLPAEMNFVLRFLWCDHLWKQMRGWFEPLYSGQTPLAELRPRELLPLPAPEEAVKQVIKDAQAINLHGWLQAVLPATGCASAAAYLRELRAVIGDWRLASRDAGFTARLPISGSLPLEAQTASWLNWLEVNVEGEVRSLMGMWVAMGPPPNAIALTLVVRPLQIEDFQQFAADSAGIIPPAPAHHDNVPAGDPAPQESLWQWSSTSLT